MKTLSHLLQIEADKWRDKYSEPGTFEESGQQEAFWAGAKALHRLQKNRKRSAARRKRKAKK